MTVNDLAGRIDAVAAMPEEDAHVRELNPMGRADVVVDGSDPRFYGESG